jgi:predicted RNA-binding Zn ribbon-like protein
MDLLWADLINSDWRDHLGKGEREDRIGNDAWLAAFLERTGWRGTRLPDLKERDALRRMREFLVVVVDRVRQGRKMSLKDLARLNRYLAAAPVVRRLDTENGSATVLLAPAVTGIDAVLGEVAASFADMMATGDPTRIKICANSDCGWVIYDESRNRTRRWCDKTECGNLIKVRRHRQRKRAERKRSTKGRR